MQHIAHTVWLAGAASAANTQGPGSLLRTVLAVLLVGAALMAWFLLRGYRSDRSPQRPAADEPGRAGGGDAPGAAGAQQGAGAPAAGRTPKEGTDAGREP